MFGNGVIPDVDWILFDVLIVVSKLVSASIPLLLFFELLVLMYEGKASPRLVLLLLLTPFSMNWNGNVSLFSLRSKTPKKA